MAGKGRPAPVKAAKDLPPKRPGSVKGGLDAGGSIGGGTKGRLSANHNVTIVRLG